MRFAKIAAALAALVCVSCSATAQNWNAGTTSGLLTVEWTRQADTYVFSVTSPKSAGGSFDLLAWTLEPFNIPEPASVVCPDGWTWQSKGGWQMFELDHSNRKYSVGGPAIEPGETLTFVYKLGSSQNPVNPGGPATQGPSFLCHVGAVSGQKNDKWVASSTGNADTWYDRPDVIVANTPEMPSWAVVTGCLGMFGCLRLRRLRV